MATETKTLPAAKTSPIGAKATLKGKTITAKKATASSKPAVEKAPRVKIERPKLEELSFEAALGMAKKANWIACVKLEQGTIYTLQVAPGVYSNLLIPVRGTASFVPTHVDRVNSPRHLPRTLRILGSWLGGGSGFGFENGAKKTGDEGDEE